MGHGVTEAGGRLRAAPMIADPSPAKRYAREAEAVGDEDERRPIGVMQCTIPAPRIGLCLFSRGHPEHCVIGVLRLGPDAREQPSAFAA